MPVSDTDDVAVERESFVSPSNWPLTAGWRKSKRAATASGAVRPSARCPAVSLASVRSPSIFVRSSLMCARRSAMSTPLMSKRTAWLPPLVLFASPRPDAGSGLSRSSMLLRPCASRRKLTRTPLAETRPTTSSPCSSGSTSTASPASSSDAKTSGRLASLSESFDSLTARRGKTESWIGPSMTSVRWRCVFIQSTATDLTRLGSKPSTSQMARPPATSTRPSSAQRLRRIHGDIE